MPNSAECLARLVRPWLGLALAFGILVHVADAQASGTTATLAEVLTPQVALGGTVRLRVDNLASIDASKLRLRLDDHVFADLLPQHRHDDEVAFDLTGLHADSGGWALLVGRPPLDGTKVVRVGLSRTDGTDLDAAVGGIGPVIKLAIFEFWRVLAGGIAIAALIFAVLRLGVKTDALRDNSAPEPGAGQRRQYSLGRCQMAFWFTLVTGSFVMIWLVTGDFNAIVSSQSLTLLGISGTTAIAAASIDAGKAPLANPPVHISFWADLLRDPSGWAFHRLQVLIWTLLLGAISVWSAYVTLALPNFDSNLLILMGVSSGLYIGFKFPEQP